MAGVLGACLLAANLTGAGNDSQTSSKSFSSAASPAISNHVIYVDGGTYPYTAAGIQAALNAAAANIGTISGVSMTGAGGTVILPDTSTFTNQAISLGSTGLVIPTGVTLKGNSRIGSKLSYTGAGFAAALLANTYHAGIENVFFNFPSPVSGQGCISLTGNALAAQWSQDNVIAWNTCNFTSLVSGTVGISAVGVATASDVALDHIDFNVITNAASPLVVKNVEQMWFNENRIDNYIAPAISIGSTTTKIIGSFRIAGSGTTGHSVQINGATGVHFTVWCDSGGADCFYDTGSGNYLEGYGTGWEPQGASTGYDTFIWNGVSNQTYTWSCYIHGTLDTGTNRCGFTTQNPIEAVYLEGTADSAGSGCSARPQITVTSGTVAASMNVSGYNFNSGPITANFNTNQRVQIDTTAGTGCTGSWSNINITVTYKPQQTP